MKLALTCPRVSERSTSRELDEDLLREVLKDLVAF